MKRLFFFATPGDVRPLLKRFEASTLLKFVETSRSATRERPVYLSFDEIDELGQATHETASQSKSYLVLHREAPLKVRSHMNRSGETHWWSDNSDNETGVTLTPAGLWKGDMLLPGQMSTWSDAAEAQQLMSSFQRALKQESFAKIRSFWLGREALAMFETGKRLTTTAEQSPPQFDLTRP